jgi:hypothetical protein
MMPGTRSVNAQSKRLIELSGKALSRNCSPLADPLVCGFSFPGVFCRASRAILRTHLSYCAGWRTWFAGALRRRLSFCGSLLAAA